MTERGIGVTGPPMIAICDAIRRHATLRLRSGLPGDVVVGNGTYGRMGTELRLVAAAAAIVGAGAILVAGCSTGSTSGSSRVSSTSYCQMFRKDWPSLVAAGSMASDAWASLQTPLADESTVTRQLRADHARYASAAALASTLAQSAPKRLKNDITDDTENPKHRLLDMSAAYATIAKGDIRRLEDVDPSQFDAGTTGCNFATSGEPDGTVATEFWP